VVLIALVASACNEAAEVETRAIEISDSGQPFDYWASVSALAAFGPDVEIALEEIGFAASRRLWDEAFAETVKQLDDDELAWISMAAVASADARSDGQILNDDQRAEMQRVVDRAVETSFGSSDRLEVVRAASTNQIATALAYRVGDVRQLLNSDRVNYIDSAIDCSPEAWNGERNWIVSERIAGSLGLDCSPESVAESWTSIVEHLEGTDWSDGVGPADAELVKIAAVVPLAYPRDFDSDDLARVQAVIDRALASLPSDPYIWLDSYRWLNSVSRWIAPGSYPYNVTLSDNAVAVLTHIASRGAVPILENTE
jgi:hypothetical protein